MNIEILKSNYLLWGGNFFSTKNSCFLVFGLYFLSFNLSFLNKCDEIERDIVKEYYQRCFDVDLGITKNLEAS